MNMTFRAPPRLRPFIAAGLMGALMLIAACASTPPAPDSALDAAKVAISNAERADANRYAGAEMGEARQKLALAESAVRGESMILAEQLAQPARVQAGLPPATAAAGRA